MWRLPLAKEGRSLLIGLPRLFFFNCVHLSSLLQISSVKNVKGVPGIAKIDVVHRLNKRGEIYRFLHNRRFCSVSAIVVIEAKAVMTTHFQELLKGVMIIFITFQRLV